MHTITPASAERWWRTRTAQITMLALLVCLGALLRLGAQNGVGRRTPDERAYTAAAQVLLAQGTAGIPVLAARAEADPFTAANPVRAGYLLLLADVMRLTARTDEHAGAGLSCAASILAVFLLAAIAWRRFSPVAAWTATLLYAVSPAALMTSRRAWQEALIEALALLLILVAAEVHAGARHPAWALVFATAGAFTVTVKQTAVLSFALCLAWIVSSLLLRREYRRALLWVALSAAAALTAAAWLAHLAGGWQAATRFLFAHMHSLDANAYSIAYEGGSPWLLVRAFSVISLPTLLLAAVAAVSACTPSRSAEKQRQITLALTLFCAVFVALAAALPHHLNLRYIAPIFGPAALLAGAGMALLIDRFNRFRAAQPATLLAFHPAPFAVFAALLLLGAAAFDLTTFRTRLLQPDVQDLSVRMVLADPVQASTPTVFAAATPEDSEDSFETWIATAVQASQTGDCASTVNASRQALRLQPNNPIAWNDLAAGFECSRDWNPAVAAAQRALQLQPDFQLARNNLNWSLEQKSMQASR